MKTSDYFEGYEDDLRDSTNRFINMSWWQRLFYSW